MNEVINLIQGVVDELANTSTDPLECPVDIADVIYDVEQDLEKALELLRGKNNG